MKTGDSDLIKQINKHRILSAFRPNNSLARIEIADITSLSPATVTVLTQELLDADLLVERQMPPAPGTRQRGRPRVALGLNADAAYVVGAKISMHQVAVSVTNFVGDVLYENTSTVHANRQPPEIIADLMKKLVTQAVEQLGLPLDRISGLGIGIPGFIDSVSGVCHWSPVFGASAIPFAAMMHERLKLPVYVDNDANLVTLAEQWFGQGKGHSDFLVVSIEHGVGMGAVIGGQLYRGHRGFGSEFGHTKIQRDGALCRCGQRGCVEAYVADYAIVREAGAFMSIPDLADPIELRQTMIGLIDKARTGDPALQQLFERAGEALGVGVANLINLFNPPLVVLSGSGVQAFDLLEKTFYDSLKASALSVEQHDTPVVMGGWDDRIWARGAAALVLQSLFEPPLARTLSAPSSP
ncbi:ROK family protein [Rhodovibrionaceae bacterium A322]